jgi:predicted ATPase
MIMLLKELKIRNLYEKYDYDVEFNNNITFIYGLNGCGKTTILNITEAIITGTIYRLFEFHFSKIELQYINTTDDTIHEIIIKESENSLTVSFNDKTVEINRLSNSELEILPENDYYNVWHSYFSKYEILKEIKATFNHAYLPLNRSNRFDNEVNFIKLRRKYLYHMPFDDTISVQDNAILKVEELIKRKYSEILSSINKYSDEFRNEILKSLLTIKESNSLSEVLDAITNKRIEVNEVNRIKESYIKILQQLNILKEEEEKSYNDFFSVFLNEYNFWKKDHNTGLPTSLASRYTEIHRIKKLVKIAEKTEQKKNEAYKPIETFIDTINEFIYNKTDYKKIDINQNGEVFFKTGEFEEPIRINSLSSGEKQLVIFFASLIFEIHKNSTGIFIVDEPELSLHLFWQSIFIEKALSINKNVQLIFATHSPEIIGKYRDKMFKLEKKLSQKGNDNYV